MAYVVTKLLNEKLYFFISVNNFYDNESFMTIFNVTNSDVFKYLTTENTRKEFKVSLQMNVVILSSVLLVNKLISTKKSIFPRVTIYSLRIFLKKKYIDRICPPLEIVDKLLKMIC